MGTIGAAAAVFIVNDSVKLCLTEGSRITTSQIEELRAAIIALETVKILKIDSSIEIYTDSNYVLKGITEWIPNWKNNGWKTFNRSPVKNKELWQRFDTLYNIYKPEMKKVKAHSGDRYNDLVDSLAKSCALRIKGEL